ncbi:unnamed protein product [Gordionus sp. m RMFG-2023]
MRINYQLGSALYKSLLCNSWHPITTDGVIPLGSCVIESHNQGRRFIITINSEEYLHPFTLAMDNAHENEKWLKQIQEASRITWHNSQLGDTLVHELEKQGLYLWSEQEKVKEKLHYESLALQNEVAKNDELKKLALDLEIEKKNMEKMIVDLKENYEKVKSELDYTTKKMERLENSRPKLDLTISSLQREIDTLIHEQIKISSELKEKERESDKFSLENQCLTTIIHELKSSLSSVESKIDNLAKEKAHNEFILQENDNTSIILKQEKQMFSDQAQELISCLKELHQQKYIAEQELSEEVMARIETKQKILLAETSLYKIDSIFKTKHIGLSYRFQNDILSNVQKLKQFFEDLDRQARQNSIGDPFVKATSRARKAIIKRAETIRTLTLPRKRVQITSETFTIPNIMQLQNYNDVAKQCEAEQNEAKQEEVKHNAAKQNKAK